MAILSKNGSFVLIVFYYHSVTRTFAARERTPSRRKQAIPQNRTTCLDTELKLTDYGNLVTPVNGKVWSCNIDSNLYVNKEEDKNFLLTNVSFVG